MTYWKYVIDKTDVLIYYKDRVLKIQYIFEKLKRPTQINR